MLVQCMYALTECPRCTQAAYNIPVLPLLIAQNALDEKYDAKYTASAASTFRVIVAFLTLSAGLVAVPFADQTVLLCVVALVGVFDSVAYGTLSQLFSLFPRQTGGCVWLQQCVDGQAAAAETWMAYALTVPHTCPCRYYFIGASLTSVLSIAVTAGTGFSDPAPTQLSVFVVYFASALVSLLGLAAAIGLIKSRIGQMYLREVSSGCGSASDIGVIIGRI
jgi:hypothetical protein